MKQICMIAAVLLAGMSMVRADFTTGMLARWTFNDTSSEKAAFTDDVSGIEFRKGNWGSDTAFSLNADGSVTLGGGIFLAADAVNSSSETFGKLGESGTIYCRIKYLNAPEQTPIFSFGLVNDTKPGDWAQLILTPFYTPNGLGSRAKGPEKQETGMASGHLPIKIGEYSDVAIVFNGKTKKVYLFVDGKMAERHSPMAKLDDFQSLMVGRLKQSNAQQMQIDEVRVYANPLSAEWLAEIEPVEKQ